MAFDFFKKNKDDKLESLLNCPRCNVKMRKVQRDDFFIDTCDKCDGLWLDKDEIVKLSSFLNNNIKAEPSKSKLIKKNR